MITLLSLYSWSYTGNQGALVFCLDKEKGGLWFRIVDLMVSDMGLCKAGWEHPALAIANDSTPSSDHFRVPVASFGSTNFLSRSPTIKIEGSSIVFAGDVSMVTLELK